VYTSTNLPENLLLLNEKTFFTIFRTLPSRDAMITNIHSPFDELFTTEWYLLPRPKTSLELSKIYEDLKRNPIYADKILITTLYESASSLLQFFSAINFSSMFFSSFLFLIVMVGLANSLRMNIRERTREIGTLRAIGMQQKDVRRLFLGEVTLLMIFSGCAGVALGILLVAFLSLIPFSSEGLIGMLLVNNHLLLIIDWGWNFFCVIFVLVLGLITAYLPSRRASRMSPSEALVHYE
jgi:putative ABC transport system permease protein